MKKKLFLISALLITMAMFAQKGEIIYVDFEPDSTQTFHSQEDLDPPVFLDLDQDGVNEWLFESRDSYHQTINLFFHWNRYTVPYSDANVMALKYLTPYPFILQLGDTLSNLQWIRPDVPQYGRNIYSDQPGAGYFPPHYIGIRVEVEDGYCYGWLEVSVNISDDAQTINLVVYSMAYCTLSDYPLCAGQTSFDWSVEDNKEQLFTMVHPNPTDNTITVTGEQLKAAILINSLGQQVATAFREGENLSIDISSLPAGIYLINITDEKGTRSVKKVVKR